MYEESKVICEETNTIPKSLYGWSKLYCEKMVEQYGELNGIDTQVLRVGHVYGTGEEGYKKIIPETSSFSKFSIID